VDYVKDKDMLHMLNVENYVSGEFKVKSSQVTFIYNTDCFKAALQR